MYSQQSFERRADRRAARDALSCRRNFLGGRVLAETESSAAAVENWLADFEIALGTGDEAALAGLFHRDGHWRDVLALTWRIETVSGAAAIVEGLRAHAGAARPSGFRLGENRTPP